MSPPPATPCARRTVAARLDTLFRSLHPRDRQEYTCEEVAAGIRAQGGPAIAAAIQQLRAGLGDHPSQEHLAAIAAFFRMPAAYFVDDALAERIDAELELLVALRDAPRLRLSACSRGVAAGPAPL